MTQLRVCMCMYNVPYGGQRKFSIIFRIVERHCTVSGPTTTFNTTASWVSVLWCHTRSISRKGWLNGSSYCIFAVRISAVFRYRCDVSLSISTLSAILNIRLYSYKKIKSIVPLFPRYLQCSRSQFLSNIRKYFGFSCSRLNFYKVILRWQNVILEAVLFQWIICYIVSLNIFLRGIFIYFLDSEYFKKYMCISLSSSCLLFIKFLCHSFIFVSYCNECSSWLLKYPFKSAPNSNLNEQLAEQVRT